MLIFMFVYPPKFRNSGSGEKRAEGSFFVKFENNWRINGGFNSFSLTLWTQSQSLIRDELVG